MIARPARLDIRCRKPWVFARLRVLGWNVRFTVSLSSVRGRMLARLSTILRRQAAAEASRPQSYARMEACHQPGRPPRQIGTGGGSMGASSASARGVPFGGWHLADQLAARRRAYMVIQRQLVGLCAATELVAQSTPVDCLVDELS